MASNQIPENVRGFGVIPWQGPKSFGKCKTAINGSCEDCCPRNNCTLCLTWSVYSLGEIRINADYAGGQYTAVIDNIEFVGYWIRDYAGDCWFIVELDGSEEARYPRCPSEGEDGQTCTSIGGEIAYTKPNGYDPEEGILSFETLEPEELPRESNIDGNCGGQFCGTCECTCKEMCFKLRPYTPPAYDTGEIGGPGEEVPGVDPETCEAYEEVEAEVPITDPCYAGGYVWKETMRLPGTNEFIDLSVSLERDPETGGCILKLASDDGYIEEETSVDVTDCMDLTATFIIQDSYQLQVHCRNCKTCFDERLPCCEGFQVVDQLCAYPNGVPNDDACETVPTKIPLELVECLSTDRLKSYRAIIQIPFSCPDPDDPMAVEPDPSTMYWAQIVFECTPSGGTLGMLTKFTFYGDPTPTFFDEDWDTDSEQGNLEPTDPGDIGAEIQFCEAPFFYFDTMTIPGQWTIDEVEGEIPTGPGGGADGSSVTVTLC